MLELNFRNRQRRGYHALAGHGRRPSPGRLHVFRQFRSGEVREGEGCGGGRPQSLDLTKREGDPTDRADVLIDHDDQQHHGFEIGHGKTTWTSVSWDSSSRSLPGIAAAFLILAMAVLVPAPALLGLATLISAPGSLIVASTLFACLSSAACGTIMMIRIEQLERQTPGPGRAENKSS